MPVIGPIGGSLGDFVQSLATVECPRFLLTSRRALGVAQALVGLVWVHRARAGTGATRQRISTYPWDALAAAATARPALDASPGHAGGSAPPRRGAPGTS
eukprot:8066167-Pyramimonas_sp.AAC.1